MFRVERTRHIFKGYGSIIRFASNKDRIVYRCVGTSFLTTSTLL